MYCFCFCSHRRDETGRERQRWCSCARLVLYEWGCFALMFLLACFGFGLACGETTRPARNQGARLQVFEMLRLYLTKAKGADIRSKALQVMVVRVCASILTFHACVFCLVINSCTPSGVRNIMGSIGCASKGARRSCGKMRSCRVQSVRYFAQRLVQSSLASLIVLQGWQDALSTSAKARVTCRRRRNSPRESVDGTGPGCRLDPLLFHPGGVDSRSPTPQRNEKVCLVFLAVDCCTSTAV